MKIKTKAYFNEREIKIIKLKNLSFFFDGLRTLERKWRIYPFVKMNEIKNRELQHCIYNILIGLIYKRMCCERGWEVNLKRFKNQMTYKSNASFIFDIDGEPQEIDEKYFDEGIKFLKDIGLIETGYHHSYIRLDGPVDYCQKLGNYLFDTDYGQRSIKNNTHYFGSHTSYQHEKAYQERLRKPRNNELLN
jgi:hypothetical protein